MKIYIGRIYKYYLGTRTTLFSKFLQLFDIYSLFLIKKYNSYNLSQYHINTRYGLLKKIHKCLDVQTCLFMFIFAVF